MTRTVNRPRMLRTAAAIGCLTALGMGGCSNGLQGAATGGALGALAGMGLGSLSGDMGKGAAAGAIIGGLGGAILGDQNARYSGGGGFHSGALNGCHR